MSAATKRDPRAGLPGAEAVPPAGADTPGAEAPGPAPQPPQPEQGAGTDLSGAANAPAGADTPAAADASAAADAPGAPAGSAQAEGAASPPFRPLATGENPAGDAAPAGAAGSGEGGGAAPAAGKSAFADIAKRLATAAVLIPLLCLLVYSGGLWMLGTVVLVTLIGVHEFYHLLEAKGAHPLRGFGFVAAGALPLVFYFGGDYQATVLMSFVLLGMLVAQLFKRDQIGESLASVSGTFFGVFYVGWLLSHVISLRHFQPAAAVDAADVGAYFLFVTLGITICSDAGAYFIGSRYGRRPLAPRISPRKTLEGAFGALACGLLTAAGCKLVFGLVAPELSAWPGWGVTLALALLVSGAGIVGDLVESLLKRDARVKDTGALLPGSGGVLDRIDSSLLAIPVMYYGLQAAAMLFP